MLIKQETALGKGTQVDSSKIGELCHVAHSLWLKVKGLVSGQSF